MIWDVKFDGIYQIKQFNSKTEIYAAINIMFSHCENAKCPIVFYPPRCYVTNPSVYIFHIIHREAQKQTQKMLSNISIAIFTRCLDIFILILNIDYSIRCHKILYIMYDERTKYSTKPHYRNICIYSFIFKFRIMFFFKLRTKQTDWIIYCCPLITSSWKSVISLGSAFH